MNTAPAEVSPQIESPDSLGPQQEPPQPDGKVKSARLWIALVAIGAILGLVVFAALHSRTRTAIPSQKGLLAGSEQELRLKGTTEAVQSRALIAPQLAGSQVPTLTIVRLVPGGSRVKKGDLLAEFDRQAQMRDFVDKQADYQKLVEQVAQEQAKEVAAKAKDETELKTAEDNLRKAELEIGKAEIVSRIDAEKNQETLEEAKATYDQLRETFDLKRKAAQAAIRILEIQRDRTQQTMLHAQSNADLMQVHAPIDGVVVLNEIWKQGTMGEVQEGDQVEPGTPFLQVVDPATMQVRVQANQQDFPRLQVGQTGKVRLDAYPDLVFSAKVDQLAPIGEPGSFSDKIRTFIVIIAIQGNDPKLMPDLSAAVDIDTGKEPVTTQVAAGGAHD